MIEKVYVACCATDVWLARICVASIRYWHPRVPICLLRDHGRGHFSTAEIERAWDVTARDSDPRYSGWGFTKLELLFQEQPEKFLFVDADTAFVGPVLDALRDRPEQFIVSPDRIADPATHHVMGVYFVYDKLKALDPAYEFPGFVFNAGQFVATSGVLKPEDFAPAVAWTIPPTVTQRDIFFSADQGFFNYLLARKAQQQALTLGTATLYYDGRSDEAAQLVFHPPRADHSFLIHWPGAKKPLASLMTRGDILDFFERHYYSVLPAGHLKRLARAAGRCLRYGGRHLPIYLYGCLPEAVRRALRRIRRRE